MTAEVASVVLVVVLRIVQVVGTVLDLREIAAEVEVAVPTVAMMAVQSVEIAGRTQRSLAENADCWDHTADNYSI